jgi:hypothetical protein
VITSTAFRSRFSACSLVLSLVMMIWLLAGAQFAGAAPLLNRFLPASHFGREVNKTTHGDACTAKEECQAAPPENSEAGGFSYLVGVAVDNDPSSSSYENVYITDKANHRVQELTPAGQFVSMFGWEVNRTKSEEGAPQAERNICTAISHNVCQAGTEGTAPGQFDRDDGIAIDPGSGDVYVSDTVLGEIAGEEAEAQRVEKFTAAGQFLLEIGKDVNQTSMGNLCLAGEKCGGAALQTPAEAEADNVAGAFDLEYGYGNVLTVGGPEDLLYVGGDTRVQEFKATGESAGKEILLTGPLTGGRTNAIAVDSTGQIFVGNTADPGVHEYESDGTLMAQTINPGAVVEALALDVHERLGIIEGGEGRIRHGVFYDITTGRKISEFAPESGEMIFSRGLAFSSSDELYVPAGSFELEKYSPVVFPETSTCAASEIAGTSARLCGEVNPDGVQAKAFFQYGPSSALGSSTATVFEGSGEAFAPISTQLTGLVPNQAYQYRIAAEAQADGEKLQGHGENISFHTAVLAPQIPGQPNASFVGTQSAVLNALINPEHTATRYHYEYGACPTLAGCTSVHSTPEETSAVNGATGFTAELSALAPSTTYSYRLVASNEFEEEPGKTVGGPATGQEGSFTTAAAPIPGVQTGAYSALTPTGAVITGIVDPEGVPVSYAFELGVYAGAGTQYGIVASGSPTAGTAPVEETMALSGLQPGTTYAYRIDVSSGYIDNESHSLQGATITFTTPGLPSVLASPTSPPLLATPSIAFPKEEKGSGTSVKTLTKKQKLAKALKLCKKDHSGSKRAKCEKTAHGKYGPSEKSKK